MGPPMDLAVAPPQVSGSPVIGLALGSGAARGWAHLGVLRALAAEGVEPQIICGCSIGAFVGAAAATGDLAKLVDWAESLKWPDVVALLDVSLRSGLIKGERLIQFFERKFTDRDFASLPIRFACVATELQSGREIWLHQGSVAEAVRASIALPGLMTPVMREGRLLVDGGLVNPVPVSLCRAMGADIVIAVDLGSDMVGKAWRRRGSEPPLPPEETEAGWGDRLLARFGLGGSAEPAAPADALPSLVSVLSSSINIMQVRIARSRLAGEPADVLISPRVGQLGLMDYHRAAEAIAEGEAAVGRIRPLLRYVLGRADETDA
ncbi:patatin-like phospholipase RssA [Azoarcus communis]|uniref:Patatin-like phospholipase RssA n=2 Tax=Parazoarcus communis TaxID=41977 RepID=A0A323UW15_9RHOO|nr:patatin-like phospholipase RssA [Parazoarcus communis]NMG69934.1 patatin-like phospholipase RssA [Parazoarcus communis SWub3 = DSM 12120]PZA16627.1 patatin-like phospholipase RssA [Azoarcus communis] [Parazoarcus communis SWub3 = DSM 12120]